MTDAAFLAAIRDDPDDDLPRLAYADWLDENGQHGRAEFIRVQVELSGGVRDRGRRVELLTRLRALSVQHRADWLGSLARWSPEAVFERGFVAQVSMSGRDFLQHAAEILAAHPVTRLRLDGATNLAADLAACPHLAGMTTLDLQNEPFADRGTITLAGSPHLSRLRVLILRGALIGAAGLRALVASPHLKELTWLDVAENVFGDAGVEALAAAFALPRLNRLDLSRNDLGPASAAHLAACAKLQGLRALRLAYNRRLTHAAVELLARSPHLEQLDSLDVVGNGISFDQAAALRRAYAGRVLC